MPPVGTFRRTEVPEPGYEGLKHLPGAGGLNHLPFYDTARFLADPLGYTQRSYEQYGPVFRVNHWGGWHAVLLGPDALELVLFDRAKMFSSQEGWGPLLWPVFPRGLMLMDFEEHRIHRKALGAAFKPEPMRAYHEVLSGGIAARVREWGAAGRLKLYPEVKRMTLDLAARAFLGYPLGAETAKVASAYIAMIQAAVTVIRTPLPGTMMAKGMAARKFICAKLGAEIPARRGRPEQDMFTLLCNAEDEDGAPLPDDLIVDHMNFLIMAAHDTLTSSITATVMYLARHPEWQEKVRAEILALKAETGPELPHARLGDMPLTEMAFKEAMRLSPPVPSLPRRALADFEFAGFRIPAGAHIGINPMFTHRMEEHWPEPDCFDPMRFTMEAVRPRHKYAWVPFGGGAHMCIGLHYALMEARIVLFHLLGNYRVSLQTTDAGRRWQLVPLPRPRDGLPIVLEAV